MIPTGFEGENHVLEPPAGTREGEGCSSLSVAMVEYSNGTPAVVSCWKLTAEELAQINKTGRVFLTVLGKTMPPALLTIDRPF